MMTTLSLSAMAQPTTPPQKATVRSGADLQTPTASNTAPYAPLPTTPTDAFTPSTATVPEAGNPADASATVPAGTEKPKGAFDPIAGGVGVVSLGILSVALSFFTKTKGQYWPNVGKLFLGAGLGVVATLLAPMGGNLVKDLYKKKSTPPVDPNAAATNPALATGIDPLTGLPQPVQQQPVGVAYPPATTTTLPGVTA